MGTMMMGGLNKDALLSKVLFLFLVMPPSPSSLHPSVLHSESLVVYGY